MKYVVMECHDGFAVLMDEGAGFVRAANLHYAVGQTVTNPIIMQETEETEQKRITVRRILPVLAAAACFAVVSMAGFSYYSSKFKTHSVVVMSSDANIKMYLNKQGDVLSLQSEDDYGAEILKNYDAKNKSKTEVANELLNMQIQEGHLTSGDTVDFYIAADNNADFDIYKTEFETEIQQVKVSVQELGSAVEPPKPAAPDPKKDAPAVPKEDPKAAAPKAEAKADPKKDPKAEKQEEPKAEPAAPAPDQVQPEAPQVKPPTAVIRPGEKAKNSVKPVVPADPIGPPAPPSLKDSAVKDAPTVGKDSALPEPGVPDTPDKEKEKEKELEKEKEKEEKTGLDDKETVKKPDEPDKPDTEVKPEDAIPALEKTEKADNPDEQEGGKPAQPAPEPGHAGEMEAEEQEKPEIHPPVTLPRPEPADGLLPKQDPQKKSEPPEIMV